MTTDIHPGTGAWAVRIDREFHNPKIIEALEHVDEATLMEILDDAEVLDALKHAAKQHEPVRPAGDFFAELKKDKLI
jgi:hypothetical protein